MKYVSKSFLNGSVCVAALVPSACGSSGGGDAAAPNRNGIFFDSLVSGMEHTTSGGRSAATVNDGKARFNNGGTGRSKLGAIMLGSAPASALLTPMGSTPFPRTVKLRVNCCS